MVAKVAPRTYITIFAALASCLSFAVLGCAGHILGTYNGQKNGNPWWLPLWPQHFDDRGLKALVGGSTSVIVLDAICITSLFTQQKWQKQVLSVVTLLATLAAGVMVIYPAVLNQQSPNRDTMQSWTCAHSSTTGPVSAGLPSNFRSICMQNRLAFYAAVPIFLLQLTVLGLSILSLKRKSTRLEVQETNLKDFRELSSYQSSVTAGSRARELDQSQTRTRSS